MGPVYFVEELIEEQYKLGDTCCVDNLSKILHQIKIRLVEVKELYAKKGKTDKEATEIPPALIVPDPVHELGRFNVLQDNGLRPTDEDTNIVNISRVKQAIKTEIISQDSDTNVEADFDDETLENDSDFDNQPNGTDSDNVSKKNMEPNDSLDVKLVVTRTLSSQGKDTGKHACKHCGKTFKIKSSMLRHGECHLSEREYQCTGCNNAFNTRVILKGHMETHQTSGNFRLRCKSCEATFPSKDGLQKHTNDCF